MSYRVEIVTIILLFYVSVGFGHWFATELRDKSVENEASPYIMIRKDSLERLIRQPCMTSTLEYMGNYILCRRRADYEPHEQERNAVLYPGQTEDRIPGDHKEKS